MNNVRVFDLTHNRVCQENHSDSFIKGVIYEHIGSHRRIAIIDPIGRSSDSPMERIDCWRPTGHHLNVVGVTFHGNPRTYSYFCSSEYKLLAGDQITIDAPSGRSLVNVEFVKPYQCRPTMATKLLPIVETKDNTLVNYYNYKVRFIDMNNGLSKNEYFYSVKIDGLPEQIQSKPMGYAVLVENKELVYYRLEDCSHNAKYGIKTFEEIKAAAYDTCNLKTKFQNHIVTDIVNFHGCIKNLGRFKSVYDKDRFLSLVDDLIMRKNKNDTIKIENKKENKTMMNMNSMFKGLEFGKVNTNDIKYSINGLAFRTYNGGYATYNLEKMEATDVEGMTFDMDCIYVMPIAAKDVKKGDVIKHQGFYVIVKDFYEDGTIAAINVNTSTEISIIPVKNIFGFNYVTKVVDMFAGMAPTGDAPFGDMNKMLPMMMLMGDKSANMKDIMMMSMLMGGNTDFASNPLMMFALMGEK